MANKQQPLYCSLLIHGVPNKFQQSEAAFLRWKDQVLTGPVSFTHDIDSQGFPRFFLSMIVHVQPQPGFLEETFDEMCAQVGLDPTLAGSFSERYLTWEQLFVSEIGSEEAAPAEG